MTVHNFAVERTAARIRSSRPLTPSVAVVK